MSERWREFALTDMHYDIVGRVRVPTWVVVRLVDLSYALGVDDGKDEAFDEFIDENWVSF